MSQSHARDTAAFQIDRVCPRRGVQLALAGRIRRRRRSSHQAMPGQPAEPGRQCRLRRIQMALGQDRDGNDHRPRPQRRIQPSCKAEADQRIRPLFNELVGRVGRTFRCAPADNDGVS
jgi:hypothetical protein